MRHLMTVGTVLLLSACEGGLTTRPGTQEPPTTNAALLLRLGGPGSELITDLVADPAGGFVALGSFEGTVDFDPGAGVTPLTSLGGVDGFLASYSASGALVWAARIGGQGDESPLSLARDAAGNLLVGGTFTGSSDFDPGPGFQVLLSAGGRDGFVARFSSAGSLVWARRFGGPNEDAVADVAFDLSGNTFAAGSFSGPANALPAAGATILSDGAARDGFLVSFDPGGALRSVQPLGGNQDDEASTVAVGVSGNPVVAGSFRGTADFARTGAGQRLTALGGTDAFLATYSTSGALQWVRALGGLADDSVTAGGLALSAVDEVFLLGAFSGAVDFDPGAGSASRTSLGAADLFLTRFDATGSFLNVLTLGGQGTVTGTRVFADPDGSVLVAGGFAGSIDFDPGSAQTIRASLGQGGATDAFIARYLPVGVLLWISRLGEATGVSDRVNRTAALAVDPNSLILAAGRFFGTPDFDPGLSALRVTSLGASDGFVVLLTVGGELALLP